MNGLAIGAVAQQTGLATSTLRYYEAIGLIPAPQRWNGRRLYDASVLQRIAMIQLAKAAGFSMSEIHTFIHGFAPDTLPATRWLMLAQAKLTEISQQIDQLTRMQQILEQGLQCGCLRLEDCVISLSGPHAGIEKTPSPVCATVPEEGCG